MFIRYLTDPAGPVRINRNTILVSGGDTQLGSDRPDRVLGLVLTTVLKLQEPRTLPKAAPDIAPAWMIILPTKDVSTKPGRFSVTIQAPFAVVPLLHVQ